MHGDKCQRPAAKEQLEFILEAHAVSGAVAAVADSPVNVAGNVCPVDLASHGLVHETPAGMYRLFWVMREVREAWSKEFGTKVSIAPSSSVVQNQMPQKSYEKHELGISTVAATSCEPCLWPKVIAVRSAQGGSALVSGLGFTIG